MLSRRTSRVGTSVVPRSGALCRIWRRTPGEKRLAVRDGVPEVEPDTGPRGKAARWIMSTTGDGTWTLVNAATGRLLEVGGQSTHDGAAVTTWTPNSGANQRWRVTDVS